MSVEQKDLNESLIYLTFRLWKYKPVTSVALKGGGATEDIATNQGPIKLIMQFF